MDEKELLWKTLRTSLANFPNLEGALPNNWPIHKKYEITSDKLEQFHQDRISKNIEGLNLPLILYNIDCSKEEKVRTVFSSICSMLDWFAKDMLPKPGAKSILEPLWLDGWQATRFWGVVSEVFFANFLVQKGFSIDGFDRTITNSKATADIATSFNGKRTWIDIEAHSLDPFEGSKEDFRRLLEHRAKKKMSAKFSNLVDSEYGVVASIYRIKSSINMDKFQEYKEMTEPVAGQSQNLTASVYWITVGKYGDGEHFLALMDRTTEAVKMGSN